MILSPPRRSLLRWAAASCAAPCLPAVQAAPDKPLPMARLLLGAPSGGVGDLMARRLADKLRGSYAQTVIVENRPGAGGQLAAVALKDGPDDGSLLLLTPSSLLSVFPHTYRSLPYRPETDLAPVALVAWSAMALAVGPAVPPAVRNFNDFLAWARSDPRLASYGSPASGSIPHLMLAALAKAAGVELTHVAYRGSTNALQDLRGGTLPAHTGPVGVFLPHLRPAANAGAQAGASPLRLLAVSGDQRSAFAPDIATYREQGHALTAREWYGFFLPGRARPAVVQRAALALRQAMAQVDMQQALAGFGLEPAAASEPSQLTSLMRADSLEWRALVHRIGFTADS